VDSAVTAEFRLNHSVLPLREITGQRAKISGNLSVFSFRGSVPSVTCFNCDF
jgi:hypothetical protein